MSVIFGIVESKKIIVAGDKRASSLEGELISDEVEKVIEINKKLVIASAGNMAIEKAILKEVEKQGDINGMTTDSLLSIISDFYKRVVENQCDTIYALPFYCLIAGMGDDGKPHLINAGKFRDGFGSKDVPMALYSPTDVKQEECNQIFVRNYKVHHNDFCERTIREISNKSQIVSPSGNRWEYDIVTQNGTMYEF